MRGKTSVGFKTPPPQRSEALEIRRATDPLVSHLPRKPEARPLSGVTATTRTKFVWPASVRIVWPVPCLADRYLVVRSLTKPVAIGPVSADEFQIARRKAVALFELTKAGR
jgi:hypothetical protein